MNVMVWLEVMARVIGVISPVMAVAAIATGFFLYSWPKKAIDTQILFYRNINWKMEPVSWPRELHNTRLMGVLAIGCGAIGLVVNYWIDWHRAF